MTYLLTDKMKSELRIMLLKETFIPYMITIFGVAAISFMATFIYVEKKSSESFRVGYIGRIFEDVRRSPHYSVSASAEFMQAIDKLAALRNERKIAFSEGVSSVAGKLREIQLEEDILQAERAVMSHPLAEAASKRTVFEEFVLTNNNGGVL